MRRPRASVLRLAAVTAVTAATVAACGLGNVTTSAGAPAGPSGPPILVGMSVSLTGDFSADGHACLRGYQLWADDVNSHGGLLGRPVKLVYLDDKSDPNVVARDYQQLVRQRHVNLLLGPFSSLLTVPAGKVARQYGYAFVEGSGGAPTVFGESLPNLFGVSAPVAKQMDPFANWVASLPPGQRPKTAAYAMVADPFADPPVISARNILVKAGVTSVYDNSGLAGSTGKPYQPDASGTVPASVLTAAAAQLAQLHPQIVVIGSVDVPTLAAFINEFKRLNFNPQMLIAASGPDQGQAFLNEIGTGNATGIMVPDGWYGSFPDAYSHVLVQEYIAKFGGTASDINADVAEAYSAGQVMANAVSSVGLNQAKIISFLHGGVTTDTVQGPARFGPCAPPRPCGMNLQAGSFIFQWQAGARFLKVLGPGGGNSRILPVKAKWVSG
jgi:branched-chain amino acid transport system substrate-binding protein